MLRHTAFYVRARGKFPSLKQYVAVGQTLGFPFYYIFFYNKTN